MFMRMEQVEGFTGLSRTRIYALMSENDFPKQVKIGARAVAWVKEEVEGWAAERIAQARRTHEELPPQARPSSSRSSRARAAQSE